MLIPVIFVDSFPDWFKYFLFVCFVCLYLYLFRGWLVYESEHTLDFLSSHLLCILYFMKSFFPESLMFVFSPPPCVGSL